MESIRIATQSDCSGRLADRLKLTSIRAWLGEPYMLKTLVWAGVYCAGATAVRALFGHSITWVNPNFEIFAETCKVLAAIGIMYCLWVEYSVCGERWILIISAVFGGWALSDTLYISGLILRASPSLNEATNLVHEAWQAIAGGLLLWATTKVTVDGGESRRQRGIQTLVRTVGLYALVAGATLCTHQLISLEEANNVWERRSTLGLQALSTGLLAGALVAFATRHIQNEDALSHGLTKFLVFITSSGFARMLSIERYDRCWWCSNLLGFAALTTLILMLWKEFGKSYADAHTRIRHMEAVHVMSSMLTTTLDIRVVLLTLVSDAANMLSARFASVMLADDAGETLTTVVTHGLPEDPLGPSKPQAVQGSGRPDFYSGHIAKAFREKRICVVDDVYTDVEFVPWRLLAKCNGYAVSVPLLCQDIALGVLNLFFDRHVPLNDERIRLFETLASAAAVAIVNAQLYERIATDHQDLQHWHMSNKLAS